MDSNIRLAFYHFSYNNYFFYFSVNNNPLNKYTMKKTIPELSDREIQEGIYRYIKSTSKSASIISTWVQIVCWLSVVGSVIAIALQLD